MAPIARPEFVDTNTGVFSWPSPPYAGYRSPGAIINPLPCDLEGLNGMTRSCLLLAIEPLSHMAYIEVPPSKVSIPIRFSQFKRITLKQPLQPHKSATNDQFAELLNHRPEMNYQLMLINGSEITGQTVGHVETDWGLFLYPPLDDQGAVQQVFMPHEAYTGVKFGAYLGQVLLEQQAVTEQQIEDAAKEQQKLRSRKLGDYLVINEVVTADQLLKALEQQARMPLMRIGEALTALRLITEDQLSEALVSQKQERNMPLGELLVRNGMLTRQDLHTALARKMGYPVVDVAHFPVEGEALKKLPYATAKRLNIMPLLIRDGVLIIAAEDPSQRKVIDELEFALQIKVAPALAGGPQIAKALPPAYEKFGLAGWDSSEIGLDASGAIDYDPSDTGKLVESLEMQHHQDTEETERPIEQSDNSLVKLINTMIIDAHTKGVSDIHIETHPGKRKLRIRFRKDGVLAPYIELPHTYRAALLGRIKIMSDLDISERRKPQDGKIDFSRYSQQHRLELRVATIPTSNGLEDVVLRLLASSRPIPMEQLGLLPTTLQSLRKAVGRPYGLVLCVGPTGSGKTTTLHSVLGHLNTPERKIWTAEDPIEITQPDLRQVQVNPKIDWTFAKALRSFLRADPDIIMVGEIRDQETAHMAIEASLTGHLVLSTLHTNSAAETVTRLLDMGMDPFNFADSLLAVLAQRLVRKLCNECRVAEPMSPALMDELLDDYLHVFPAEWQPERQKLLSDWIERHGRLGQLMRFSAPGCPQCEGKGVRGRAGLHELMTITPELRRLIQTKGRAELVQHAAQKNGMLTLRQDGIEKVLSGLTSIEEVRANTNV